MSTPVQLSFIVLGNPGTGKSSIMNALAGDALFESGLPTSFGHGLTYNLNKLGRNGIEYIDTPGLADKLLRERAARDISDELKKGGHYKILFVIRQQYGRPVEEDITTAKLILEAAPEIKSNFGIIINMVPSKITKLFRENEETAFDYKVFLLKNLAYTTHMFFMERLDDLEGEKNKVLDIKDYIGYDPNNIGITNLESFAWAVPPVQLTKDKAGDVDATDARWEALTRDIHLLMKKLDENTEELEAARKQIRKQVKINEDLKRTQSEDFF